MSYITIADVKNYTGFNNTDFKESGLQMNEAQFNTLLTSVIDGVTQAINSFCNVSTLEEHDKTEYFNGRTPSGDDGQSYTLKDRTYYLRENCIECFTVYEDVQPSGVPTWTSRTPRSESATGDYDIYNESGSTFIVFLQNIPSQGNRNVKVLYSAGYEEESNEFNHIKLIALKMAANVLLYKKKIQESTTIRQAATEDYGKMFEIISNIHIMTPEIVEELSYYKRWYIDIWSS